ncbi:hypothetical protein ATANTOWER_014564 [Ataeniobius toweri]|uniref:Uncharacterized protein n=1 Tax=Ataeniobius toweri TaxID=208326 RepID=A0ABU7AB88_9TELE|nr:hypothetical protein [Ataeniobius toweri]
MYPQKSAERFATRLSPGIWEVTLKSEECATLPSLVSAVLYFHLLAMVSLYLSCLVVFAEFFRYTLTVPIPPLDNLWAIILPSSPFVLFRTEVRAL